MKENKRKIIIVSVAIAMLLFVLIGATYAYFSASSSSDKKTIKTVSLGIKFDDNSAKILAEDIIPVKSDKIFTDKNNVARKSFKLMKKEKSEDLYTTINLTDISITENLANYDFKWALYQGENKIATGNFGGHTSGSIMLAADQVINTITGIDYDLYIWINETDVSQNDMQGGRFEAKLTAKGTDIRRKTLSSVILGTNNSNVLLNTPTFSDSSTDRGLFVQEGDITKSEMGFPTYYFRGSTTNTNEGYNPDYVMNNYVKFGTYKTSGSITFRVTSSTDKQTFTYTEGDPIVWRVVRINEDGTIRLITENPMVSPKAWNSDGKTTYINEDGTDSTVKSELEKWYKNNIAIDTNLDNKVAISTFCSDTSYDTNRFKSSNSTFICLNNSIKAYEKIGLITIDELVYGGGNYGKAVSNNTTYLNNNSWFWTLTPYAEDKIFYWRPTTINNAAPTNSTVLVLRGVINLNPDAIVTSGDGLSADTAYVVE